MFSPCKGTPILNCVKKGHIYTLTPGFVSQVRFIITRDLNHPILGLFSDNTDQVAASRQQLESDGWPVRRVSAYLGELFSPVGTCENSPAIHCRDRTS